MKIKLKSLLGFNELMIRKGYSENRLGRKIGISSPMMVQITNGVRFPSPETAKKIIGELEVDFDEIFEMVTQTAVPEKV